MKSNVGRVLLVLLASLGLGLLMLASAFAAGGPGAQCTGEYVEQWYPVENHPDGGVWKFKSWTCLGTCNPGTCMEHRVLSTPDQWQCCCNVGGPYWDWTMVVDIFHESPGSPPAPGSTYCDVQTTTRYGVPVASMCIGECEEPLLCRQMDAWVNVEGEPPNLVRTRGTQCTCQP